MSDLTDKEQKHVRTALRFLRLRVGAWAPIAEGLRFACDTVEKTINGRRPVTPAMALRVARLADVSVDDLLAGRWLSPRTCPHCGHPPDDFTDEETIVEDGGPRKGVLKLIPVGDGK